MHKRRIYTEDMPEMPWPLLSGGLFTDILQRVMENPDVGDMSYNVLKKCGWVKDYDEFEAFALKPSVWPIGADMVQIPIMLFNVARENHWKFTPQCEVYPIAKSMCLTGFREDYTHPQKGQRYGLGLSVPDIQAPGPVPIYNPALTKPINCGVM